MTDTAASAAPLPAPWPSRLLTGLVDGLSSSGVLTPDWRAAFLAVPRHLFVPDLVWRGCEDGCGPQLLRRAEQPQAWLKMVHRDEPVITQINDGDSRTASHTVYTSSTSMPSVAAEMLTALLAHRLTGDGALGHPQRAPYDRVLSTTCVYQVPHPWIAQTRPGGLVLTPWGTEYYNGHLLAFGRNR